MQKSVSDNKAWVVAAIGAGVTAFAAYKWFFAAGHPEREELIGMIEDPKFKDAILLYKEEAQARSRYVRNAHYSVTLSLEKGETCDGHAILKWDLESIPDSLFMDYHGVGVSKLILNGQALDISKCFEG